MCGPLICLNQTIVQKFVGIFHEILNLYFHPVIPSMQNLEFARVQSMQWPAGELPAGECIGLGELFRLNAPISSGLRVTACLQEERCSVLLRLVLVRNDQFYSVILEPTSGISDKRRVFYLLNSPHI